MKPLRAIYRRFQGFTSQRGFTLLELLITTVLISILLAAISVILSSHLKLTDSETSMIQSRRESARLNYILNSESNEACALKGGSDPSSCSQTCATTASSDLRLRVPVIINGTTAGTRFIRYYLSGTELRRDGPAIKPDGQLDLSQSNVDSLLIDSVSAFMATIDSDCHAATISLSLSFPAAASPFTSAFSVRTNVEAVSK
jgi:prepilin-type N-terminal cleavage/methylation domain-containing protein